MPPIDRVLDALEQVHQHGAYWTARCPAHADRNPSLSVSEGDDGRVLLHCHAGCTFQQIMAALNLQSTDAFADTPLDPVKDLERRVRTLEQKQAEHEERLRKLEQLRSSNVHMQYHRNLTPSLRDAWYQEGIFDEAIDRYLLGYARSCPTWPESASMTIPIFGYANELENVRHRLLTPGKGGKYRPEMPGLGSQLFNAPVLRRSHERVLIVEGEKKSIVMDQAGYPTVGVMGCSNWKPEWFGWFDAGRVIVCFDPGAEDHALKLGSIFAGNGFSDVRVARFPMKPDDMIVRADAGSRDIEAILSVARPVRAPVAKSKR
jgi:DNA primase